MMPIGLAIAPQKYPGINNKLYVVSIIPADRTFMTSSLLLGKATERPNEAKAPEEHEQDPCASQDLNEGEGG